MPLCCLCEYIATDEIVTHIDTNHEGLAEYLKLFPNHPVVSSALSQSLEDFELQGKSEFRPGFDKIGDGNRKLIVCHNLKTKPSRSEIIVGPFLV